MPIRARIDMLATGIRTPIGIKVFGSDLAQMERVAREIEAVVPNVPGTTSAYAERLTGGSTVEHRYSQRSDAPDRRNDGRRNDFVDRSHTGGHPCDLCARDALANAARAHHRRIIPTLGAITMKITQLLLAAILAGATAATLAQHSGHPPAAGAPAATELADGEVRRIDLARGTILLKHGDIPNLGMGPMTMGFKLKDPAAAKDLKVGDKVKFAAEQQGETLIVTQIRKTP
jgi:Cu/Ag efflux protein CusF